jgi:hypothetical protein
MALTVAGGGGWRGIAARVSCTVVAILGRRRRRRRRKRRMKGFPRVTIAIV